MPSARAHAQIRARGGRVVFLPTEEEWSAAPTQCIEMGENVTYFPACHEGVNRSQVMYRVLAQTVAEFGLAEMRTMVELPHGAVRRRQCARGGARTDGPERAGAGERL